MTGKKDINVSVGANIKRERKRAGYTQERFSEMIGIGPKSLSAVERGTVGVSLSTLLRICKVLSVSSDVLLLGDPPKNDVQDLTSRLELLPPEQYRIVKEIFDKLLEAFTIS